MPLWRATQWTRWYACKEFGNHVSFITVINAAAVLMTVFAFFQLPYLQPDSTYKIHIHTFNKTLTQAQKIKKIDVSRCLWSSTFILIYWCCSYAMLSVLAKIYWSLDFLKKILNFLLKQLTACVSSTINEIFVSDLMLPWNSWPCDFFIFFFLNRPCWFHRCWFHRCRNVDVWPRTLRFMW